MIADLAGVTEGWGLAPPALAGEAGEGMRGMVGGRDVGGWIADLAGETGEGMRGGGL